VWHELVSGDDPLNGLGEGRQLAHLNKTKELLAGDIGARPVRHLDGEVLDGPQARAATALWMRKNSEHRGRVREEEEEEGKARSKTCARRTALKGTGLTSHPQCWACRVSRTPAHSRARPSKTTAHSRNASVSMEYGRVESAHSHDGAVTSVTSAEMLAPITAPMLP
jgi:hypothetical protein